MPYIDPPKKTNPLLRLGIRVAEKKTGKRMLPARILAWYPKAAVGAGILEALVAHDEPEVPARILKLVRMQTSFSASCPFCIDMNSAEFDREGITREEIEALQNKRPMDTVASITQRERTALEFARGLSATPILVSGEVVSRMKALFGQRGFVIVATTIAQVNHWTRLIQGLGIPPAGFSATCDFLELEKYQTLRTT